MCRGNRGAFHLAEEVKKTAGKGRCSAATSAAVVVIREAEEALEGANAAPLSGHVVLLLYLNEKTFLDPGGAVARLVQVAMDRRIAVVLVHEQGTLAAAAFLSATISSRRRRCCSSSRTSSTTQWRCRSTRLRSTAG